MSATTINPVREALVEEDLAIVIQVQPPARLLAHTLADGAAVSGIVEPLVGQEWRLYAGQEVAYTGVAFAPGAVVEQEQRFIVERHGVWMRQGKVK